MRELLPLQRRNVALRGGSTAGVIASRWNTVGTAAVGSIYTATCTRRRRDAPGHTGAVYKMMENARKDHDANDFLYWVGSSVRTVSRYLRGLSPRRETAHTCNHRRNLPAIRGRTSILQ